MSPAHGRSSDAVQWNAGLNRRVVRCNQDGRCCGTFEAFIFGRSIIPATVSAVKSRSVMQSNRPSTGYDWIFHDLAIAATDRCSRPLPNVSASRSIVVSSMSSAAVRRNSAFSERRTSNSFDGCWLLRAGAGSMCLEYLMKSPPEIPLT
jgi:hypothetical protein